jgi:hypothetical protein
MVLTVEQGDFGTGTEQTLTELSASVTYRAGAGAVRATLPYLSLESAGTRVQGAGDVRLDGSWRLRTQQGLLPALRALAALKLPTADAQAGLGTGEADVALGLAADAFVSDDAYWFADVDYTWVGHDADYPLLHQWRLGAGGGLYLSGTLVLSATLDGRTPAYAGESAPLSLGLGLAGGERIVWQLAVRRGLSTAAADVGVALGLGVDF